MKREYYLICNSLLFSLLAFLPVAAQDWNEFRGLNGVGGTPNLRTCQLSGTTIPQTPFGRHLYLGWVGLRLFFQKASFG